MLVQAGPRSRVAVVLNGRARGVEKRVITDLGRIVPNGDLFLSRNLDHSRHIARTVVERGYDAVLLGGGDGTFVQCLHDLTHEANRRQQPLPSVGVLRLGTGNALADALGASAATPEGFAADLRRARRRPEGRLQLLTVDGKSTPFAGCGLDAQILDDFGKLGHTLDSSLGKFARHLGANSRYALTVGLRSIPRFLTEERPVVEVINTGSPAYVIDWKTGQIKDKRIPTGGVLFRGPASIASASTIPFYGLGLKLFPYTAEMPGMFQMRCATADAGQILANLPAIFKGTYRAPHLYDFLCDAVEVRMERPVPVQIGGDLQNGKRDHLVIERAAQPLTVFSN